MPRFLTLVLAICLYAGKHATIKGETDRIYKPGDEMIGGLLALHRKNTKDGCKDVFLPGINRVQAALFAIEQINKNVNILPNVQLGYDIRDYCMDKAKAMEHTYHFSTQLHLLRQSDGVSAYQNDTLSACYVTCSACMHCLKSKENSTRPIAAIVGPYGSQDSLQVAGLLQVVNIPAISPAASSQELSWPFYSKFLRAVPPDNFQARAMADLIDYFGWTYVAVIAEEDSYGIYGFRALEHESLQRETFCIGLVQYITPTRYENQLKPIVAKLKRAESIKVIVFWIGDVIARDLTREAHKQNLRDRVWIMSDSLSTKTPEFLGSELMSLGVYLGVQPRQFRYWNYEDYIRNLTPKIHKTQINPNPWFDILWREEFLNCSTKNYTKYDECPDDLKISNDLYMKMSDDFIPYQIDAIYAIAHALDMIYRCKKPSGLLPGGDCPPTKPFVRSSDVLLYLRNVSFDGLTGRVEFDDHGDPLQAAYDIVSFQRPGVDGKARNDKHVKVKIGKWDANSDPIMKINTSAIIWNFGNGAFANDTKGIPKSVCLEQCPPGTWQTPTVSCCWQCLECPDGEVNPRTGSTSCIKCEATQKASTDKTACLALPIENLHWNSVSGIILSMFTSLGYLLTFFTAIVFVRHGRSPIVKAANRELSFLLLVNIALGFVLPMITISQPTQLICAVIEPWRYITSSISVSVLLVKTMKLLRAFQVTYVTKWMRRTSSSTSGQLTSVILLNVTEVVLAVLWGALDPPCKTTDIEKGKYILFTCKPYQTLLGRALEVTMLTYLILLSLVCAYYAFKARTLPENFNEARFIGFAMYILLLSWITFYPVQSSLQGWYVAVVSCTTALISSYGVLACMYAPKVYVIIRHPEQNTAQFMRNELRTANNNLSIAPVTGICRLSQNTLATNLS